MRISRKKRPQKPLIPRYDLNHKIRVPEVRVLDEDNSNLGVMNTKEAVAKAQEMEMDLVIINPKADPPVAKIMDFTNFKYQKEKEARKQKKKSHVAEIKGVRLSLRIGKHDLEVRTRQALKFLNRGDKVKVEIILKGRDHAHSSLAFEVIEKFYQGIIEEITVDYEQKPQKQGPKITAILTKK